MNQPDTFEAWSPVTHDFGLVDATPERIRDCYTAWWKHLGDKVEVRTCTGTLEALFGALLPLSIAKNRTLLLPTVSGWTAFFRNGIQGSDPGSSIPVLARQLGVRAMRICLTPPGARYQAAIWEMHGPQATSGHPGTLRRSIAAANDGGRWVFEQHGEPFPFERTERYDAVRKRDRFGRDLLLEYVAELGIKSVGDQMFGDVGQLEGLLIAMPPWDWAKSYSLEETRAGVPWQR